MAKRFKIDTKSLAKKCREATDNIVIGNVYFLSSFYDKSGADVKVLSKNKEENKCGWPSGVEVQVLNVVSDGNDSHITSYYHIGRVLTVNACNLYTDKKLASHEAKFPHLKKFAEALTGYSE